VNQNAIPCAALVEFVAVLGTPIRVVDGHGLDGRHKCKVNLTLVFLLLILLLFIPYVEHLQLPASQQQPHPLPHQTRVFHFRFRPELLNASFLGNKQKRVVSH
jgi:hypothetical protein